MNERIDDLFAVLGEPDELNLIRLPERRWQNLHDFAKESLSQG